MRRIPAGFLALCMLFALVACKGEVTKKRKVGDQHQILAVDGKKERWIDVDKDTFDSCAIHEWYEDGRCMANRPTMRNIPVDERGEEPAPELNPPRRDSERDDQDRNARTVCFDFVSDPKRKLVYRWSTPRREEGPREGTWGIYSKCVDAEPGQVVNMTVEHITGPSTLLCTINVIRKGKKVPIDFVITQAFGDCKVSARVPAN